MEECYILEPLVIRGLSLIVNLGISFLKKHKLKLICMEEEDTLMPVKDGSALRAQLVDQGCHNFISKRTGRVVKATVDQRISVHVWRIPRKEIIINTLNERPEEAAGEYAKENCSIPAEMGKYIPVQMNFEILVPLHILYILHPPVQPLISAGIIANRVIKLNIAHGIRETN